MSREGNCWEPHLDEASGSSFYYNSMTGATTWEPPSVIAQGQIRQPPQPSEQSQQQPTQPTQPLHISAAAQVRLALPGGVPLGQGGLPQHHHQQHEYDVEAAGGLDPAAAHYQHQGPQINTGLYDDDKHDYGGGGTSGGGRTGGDEYTDFSKPPPTASPAPAQHAPPTHHTGFDASLLSSLPALNPPSSAAAASAPKPKNRRPSKADKELKREVGVCEERSEVQRRYIYS